MSHHISSLTSTGPGHGPKVQVVAAHSLVCIQIHPRHEGRTRNRHAPVVERDYSVSIGGVGAVHQDTGVSCRQCINAMNANEAVFGDGLDLGTLAHVYRVARQYGGTLIRSLPVAFAASMVESTSIRMHD